MHIFSASAFVLGWLVVVGGASDRVAVSDSKWESRGIDALATGNQKALRLLAEEYIKLTPADRGKLPVRIRDDAIEFAFHGEFPGDKTPWSMLEYLASVSGKDYETLLVVSEAELMRVQTLRPFFDKQPQKGRGKLLSARLTWVEDGRPGSVDLVDLLAPLKAVEREQFRDQIAVNTAGLGGDLNFEADAACLPRRRVAALLLVTIQLPPRK
jgi:hypothetical protein